MDDCPTDKDLAEVLAECSISIKTKASNQKRAISQCDISDAISVANRLYDKSNAMGISSVSYWEESFPASLRAICDEKGNRASPPVIFYKGNLELLSQDAIAVIGTRHNTDTARVASLFLSQQFAERGFSIVSGLAIGCDTFAHEGALSVSEGKTIAVLPSSIDKIIPAQNTELARRIVKNGGLLVSEYSVTSVMNKFNYPQRDRIQSLLSNVSIIIESLDDGGTMIAVKKSLNDGKKVFAIEGNHLILVRDYFNPDSNQDLINIESFI